MPVIQQILASASKTQVVINPVNSAYLIAGQSNTTGVVPNSGLPQWFVDQGKTMPDVIWMDNPALTFSSYSVGSNAWAYELLLYKLLTDYKQQTIYAIKQDESGTSISPEAKTWGDGFWTTRIEDIPVGKKKILPDWESRINTALGINQSENLNFDIKCVVWHQGESDSFGDGPSRYYNELKMLIAYIRTALNKPNLPWVLGGINASSTSYSQAVQDAKIQIALEDINSHYVEVENGPDYLLADSLHWNFIGAEDFANKVFQIIKDF